MNEFSNLVLAWYARHGRRLPWRGNPDVYAIWISEIMLQQTRVDTVLPYYQRWMERFPDVASLAVATEQDVLSTWEGLGYYSRARNLHKAARIIIEEFGGQIPRDLAALYGLPGIGRYTSRAIASMAYGMDVATLDGNIRRIFARVFDINESADSAPGEKILWALAEKHLPKGHAGEYNQALMDLGATVCLPRNPTCLLCPVRSLCKALALGIQEQRPVMKLKAQIPHYLVTAAVMRRDGRVLVARRPSKGLLGGMWEFPGGKVEEGETFQDSLKREIQEELGVDIRVGKSFGVYRHAYTHFRITLHAFLCELAGGEPRSIEAAELAWVSPIDLTGYPMGKVDRQIARSLQ